MTTIKELKELDASLPKISLYVWTYSKDGSITVEDDNDSVAVCVPDKENGLEPRPEIEKLGDLLIKSRNALSDLIRVIELAEVALEHYTKVVTDDNDPNFFAPKVKDGGSYARNALSEIRKLKGEKNDQ